MSDQDHAFLSSKFRFDPAGSSLNRMMTQYFMEYASYVIKDRAIPHIDDGLKPVQRRILHTLFSHDDGKFHKVANMVGATMSLHPHGDTSIYGALVTIANKDYFIEKQGNFGNIHTGDNASAARYIECRLSPLARENLFNPELTGFIDSYDGRNKEPIVLPSKLPALLLMGAEGIAVGLATTILPHNFNELLDAQIELLRGRPIEIFPDFLTGGLMDVSEYDRGLGRIRLRAVIETLNQKTLVIRQVPYGVTTEQLIESIEDAVREGKLKISSIQNFTTDIVEIEINIQRGISAEQTLEALYAFTKCQVSISSNPTVIQFDKPTTINVCQILHHNTQMLVDYLRLELELELHKLNERMHARTLERIFIEERIYKRIEECPSRDAVSTAVKSGLAPFVKQFRRALTEDDVRSLLEIPIRRISLFDIEKNRLEMAEIQKRMDEIRLSLADMKSTTIEHIKTLKKRYGHLYPRRTQIQKIEKIDVKQVALANLKLGVDRAGGYIGTKVNGADTLKCSEFDKLLVVFHDGRYKIINVPDKLFIGRFMEAYIYDREQVFSIIYRDKKSGLCYAKRSQITSFITDKEYQLCPAGAKMEVLETNYGVVLDCEFEAQARSRTADNAELAFEDFELRSPSARGFKVSDRKIVKFLKTKRGSEKRPDAAGPVVAAAAEADQEAPAATGWKAPTPIRFQPSADLTIQSFASKPAAEPEENLPAAEVHDEAPASQTVALAPEKAKAKAPKATKAKAAKSAATAAPEEPAPAAPSPKLPPPRKSRIDFDSDFSLS